MVKQLSTYCAILLLLGGMLRLNAADADTELRDKALKLNQATGGDVVLGNIRALLKDQEGTKKLLVVAAKMAEEKPLPFNYNAAFVLARAAHLMSDFDKAQRFYKICSDQAVKLQSASKLIEVYDGLIELFYQSKKFDDAIKACQEFLEIKGDPDSQINKIKPFIMERMIQALARKGKIDEAMRLTTELVEADEGGWYFVQLKGWVQREAGKLDEAAETYLDAIERIKKSKIEDERKQGISDGIRYMLSGIYVDAKKIEKAAEQLQTLLKRKPDNATYNNDLGYIWADHDMNLDESEKLIRKALELDRKRRKADPDTTPEEDKDNPAFLDSLGWVLFKKKDYKEAKKHLLDAIKEKEGQHIEILDHLADVHMALGEKEEAIKVWKKALEQPVEEQSKREKERRALVEKKLKDTEEKK